MNESGEGPIIPQVEKQGFLQRVSTKLKDFKRGYSDADLETAQRIASGNITGDDIADERRRQLRGVHIPEGTSAMSVSSRILDETHDIRNTPGLENKEKMIRDARAKLERWQKT